jgi:hypothetical protein
VWKRVLAVVAAAILAFVVITGWALESGGVAVLETRQSDGTARQTHVWFVVQNGELWIEAGTPDNSWFRDVQRDPTLLFESDDLSGSFTARLDEDPSAHPRLRAALREKYGLRDRWVGLFVDSSQSLAVQLHPNGP